MKQHLRRALGITFHDVHEMSSGWWTRCYQDWFFFGIPLFRVHLMHTHSRALLQRGFRKIPAILMEGR